MIQFLCPSCHATLSYNDSDAGCTYPCPQCGQQLLIPHPAGVPDATKTILDVLRTPRLLSVNVLLGLVAFGTLLAVCGGVTILHWLFLRPVPQEQMPQEQIIGRWELVESNGSLTLEFARDGTMMMTDQGQLLMDTMRERGHYRFHGNDTVELDIEEMDRAVGIGRLDTSEDKDSEKEHVGTFKVTFPEQKRMVLRYQLDGLPTEWRRVAR